MTTEPRTNTGQSAVTAWHLPPRIAAAIETEAARLALEDVAERVRHGLVVDDFEEEAVYDTRRGWEAAIRAVLSLLSTKEEGS